MTDRHQDHLDPLADDREVAALRALFDDAGLLPELPASHQPTAASAERVLARVLASAEEPGAASAADTVAAGTVTVKGREVALAARRRRTRTTQALFGLAATVLVGAVIVVPMVAQDGDDDGIAGVADSVAVAPETARRGAAPQTEGQLPATGGAEPHGLVADALVSGVLVGTVVDDRGCLSVREDTTGVVYVPVDTPGVTVREHLVVGDQITLERVADPHAFDDADVPEGCDPTAFLWPTASFGTNP